MQFGTHEKIQLEAWVSEGLARLLQEAPISHDMLLVAEDDGSRLTATVNDSWELKWWVLSHAGAIQICKPQCLHDEITQRLKSALELHITI
jgi:predicted DNA-binding transcriptional regulator YafY